jgi:REP element-mobilizing transposase RayT
MGIKEHFTGTELSAFIIMPNHLHGIIIIKDNVGARHAVPADFTKPSESFGNQLNARYRQLSVLLNQQ